MASKETPKKIYSSIDPLACRLCRSVGDANHRKNLFKHEELLKTAEQLCGHPLPRASSLPHLLCRPCERRLKNVLEFQRLILTTQEAFRQQQPSRVKRCIEVSPSVSQRQKSRLPRSSVRSARMSLNLGEEEPSSDISGDVEVSS